MGKVLLIGWDAADWKILHPLLDSGKMVHLSRLIKNGVMGNLASLRPELSPMLWTSIATGKRPYKHGILGFTEPGPDGKGMRPVTNLSRKTKAIWNILNQNGYRSLVVGWWPSHPAEPINGVMVSNHFQRAVAPHGAPWPLQKGTISPLRLRKNLVDLRVHPQDLDPGLMQLFVPHLAEIDQEKDRRIESLAKIIAEAMTGNRAATALMHHEQWDFTAVYFDAIDHFCHGFMDYYPPRLPRVSAEDYRRYRHVVESGYVFHDILLGSLLEEVDADTTVILVSDHGFHSDHLRPVRIPGEPAGPAAQHRPYGIIVMSGPGIKKDELLYGSSLLDICPTVLSCYGLPVGSDMDGKVLVNGFAGGREVQYIPSWDDVQGKDGSHPADSVVDPLESSEAVRQLVELGYIEEPDANEEKAALTARRELFYNLARSYMDGGLYGEAAGILEELSADWPGEFRFGIELVHCYQATGRAVLAKGLLEDILLKKEQQKERAAEELEKIKKELAAADDKQAKLEELKPALRRLQQERSHNPFGVSYLSGVACMATGEYQEALQHFQQAECGKVVSASLFVQKAVAYAALKQRANAEQAYQKALEIDSENSDAMLGLCRLQLESGKNREAAHLALDVIALRYHSPPAHFYLGWALHRLGKISDAVKALQTAIRQNPNFPEAYHRLAYIYKKRLHLEDEAAGYKQAAKEARLRIRQMQKGLLPLAKVEIAQQAAMVSDSKGGWRTAAEDLQKSVVIVSGLPRSGTSLIMQMLEAGGFPVLSDEKRKADADNPKGYFEHEGIKRLAKDNQWLQEHTGSAVKIIAQLVPFLPDIDNIEYRIIFIERNLDEILLSQEKMLANLGKQKHRAPQALVKSGFYRQVESVKAFIAAKNWPVLYVRHQDCINNTDAVVAAINRFMDSTLDTSGMADVVDRSLYRNRVSQRE